MDSESFACTKRHFDSITRPVQRNILIAEYCADKFGAVNLVDFYYRKANANDFFVFLLIALVVPVLFINIRAVADKFLSLAFKDLSEKFQLSQAISAAFLVALANNLPELVSTLAHSTESASPVAELSVLLCSFIFSSTLLLANAIFHTDEKILMPKFAVLKELLFYLCGAVVVFAFGLAEVSGLPLIFTLLSVYILYVLASFWADKKDRKKRGLVFEEEENSVFKGLKVYPVVKRQSKESRSKAQSNALPLDQSPKPSQLREREDEEENEPEEAPEVAAKSFMDKLAERLVDKKSTWLYSIFTSPFRVLYLLTIPNPSNPFMTFPLNFAVVFFSAAFWLKMLGLLETGRLILVIAGSLAAASLLLELMKFKRSLLDAFHQLLGVLAAVAWIQTWSMLFLDVLVFLGFYFSANPLVLSVLLISAGNTIDDFFSNAALVKKGEVVMGALACYSGQTFALLIGLSASELVRFRNGETEFDIFGLSLEEDNKNEEKLLPLKNERKLLAFLLGFALVVGLFQLVFYPMRRYAVSRKFGIALAAIFGVFVIGSLCFGLALR